MEHSKIEHERAVPNRHLPLSGVSAMAEAFVENLSIGLIMVDGEGTVRYMNNRAERVLQVSRDEVVGKRVYMLPLKSAVYKVLSENCRNNPVDVSLSGVVLQVKATSVICREGSCLGDMYELRDITPERRVRRQGDEFVATMTHDLKSPLTVMLGYVDSLARDTAIIKSSRAVNSLQEMRRSGHRLLAMIEDILDSYRLDAGLVQIRREYCDFGSDLAGCCSELRHDADMHNVRLEYKIDQGIPFFKVDSAQICRVFSNLVGNAIKFTPSGGKVAVDAVFTGKELVVTVADTGIGISAKDQAKIFSKYFRSDRAKGYKGTGLGLTIAKALVEAHGGSIQVASSEGSGSCFTVTLPVESPP